MSLHGCGGGGKLSRSKDMGGVGRRSGEPRRERGDGGLWRSHRDEMDGVYTVRRWMPISRPIEDVRPRSAPP